jgi:hypothetical protein
MQSFKLRAYIFCCALCVCSWVSAQLSESARISLLTCTPGDEVYTRYGHTAIRVCDTTAQLDVVFNYGIFDFNTDFFYWKFVRGETWYELGITSTPRFDYEYKYYKRPVYEQELNLSSEQKEALWQALVTNYQPENRKYLYNFVFDNCATRPYQLIKNALGDSIHSDYIGYKGQTYRTFLRHYTGAHRWINAGINLLFGPKADQPMTDEQRLFLPEELMHYMAQATLSDGTRLVANDNGKDFIIPPTPWYATWELGLVLYFLCMLAISIYDRKRNKWSWGVDLVVAIPYIIILIIVSFLTFFSCHPLVGFGWRLLIIPCTHLCARLIYICR